MSNTKTKDHIIFTEADSTLWGLITLIPFGWIILWININGRRKEVERGVRDKESALASIKNYAAGATVGIIGYFIIMCAASQGKYVSVPNIIAIIILAISAINNTSRIKKIESSGNSEKIGKESVLDDENDNSYYDYSLKIRALKKRLESIDRSHPDYEASIKYIKEDVWRLFDGYKDAIFENGGKYKIYELKAEYFFVIGNKQLAEKYIKKAIEIRRQEKNRIIDSLPFEGEDDEL
ncbi:hypothetical protein IKP94_02245 [Candidatus Saccharibacteria bacterium]|nr:hypothetical protein [Candidatus Saccharibacteria bacterium]